ncbi:MAG: hypothetical protein HZA06_03105 [Nitrospirae bacterium]|nr:hypothetical protein [Nitrospirota bacterium]
MTKEGGHKKGRKFYPHHLAQSAIMVAIIFAALLILSYYLRVPSDPMNVPMPDDGMYIPGPEWYSIFFFQPFWYLTGKLKKFEIIGTFFLPVIVFLSLLILPFLHRKKEGKAKLTASRKLTVSIPVLIAGLLIAVATVRSGYPAKVHGCTSCHNPSMGMGMGTPPLDVGEFYRVNRQRQIQVGKFKAGKTVGEEMTVVHGAAESYKDANWQMRHMYEPTFTW